MSDFAYLVKRWRVSQNGEDVGMCEDLTNLYNNGWKPTGMPLALLVREGRNGTQKVWTIIYTLAKETNKETT